MRNNQNRLGPAPNVKDTDAPVSNLGFVVPTEFVELPSRGRFYSADHPLHNQETVEIKYMTAKEEDLLASTTLIKKGMVIDRLLQNIMIENVDPSSLLVGDRNAIMISARVSSYGYAYKADVRCPSCGENQEYDFDLREANLNDDCFDEAFLSENKIKFNSEDGIYDIALPASDVSLGIKILTGAGEKAPEASEIEESVITYVLSKYIVSVNGNKDLNYVSQFIDNMLASDSRYLRRLLPSLSPNIDLKQEFLCKHCKASKEMEVPLTAEFFWPE